MKWGKNFLHSKITQFSGKHNKNYKLHYCWEMKMFIILFLKGFSFFLFSFFEENLIFIEWKAINQSIQFLRLGRHVDCCCNLLTLDLKCQIGGRGILDEDRNCF